VRVFDLDSIEHDPIVSFDDLRALLDAYDTARAEGVAADRARVVAWLRAADSETLVWFAAQRIEQGWHDKEGCAMNDETKAELMKRTREWLQSCVNAATRSGVPEEADLEAFILAHIDGEPARRAAVEAERDALRAQMEAAREAAERIVKTQWRMPDCYITATAILRAMDEAAKK
jgi:hypothetical protein